MASNRSKRIPFDQFIIGLDKLFFGRKLENQEQAEEQADLIEAYLEGCCYSWDDILEEMCREETPKFLGSFYN